MIYPLQVFAEFELNEIWDSSNPGKVCFNLVHGVDSIECEMRAKKVKDWYCVPVDNNPQNDVDREFEYLEVDCETEVLVDGLDYVQKIKLTEKQMLKLNEYLKDEMKMI